MAGVWLMGSNVSTQALRLFSSLVLTRLLQPQAFGLMAAVNTLYFGLVMFSDLGVWQSVVKSERGEDAQFLGTAWAVQLMRSGLLMLLVFVISLMAFIAGQQHWVKSTSLYADSQLPWLMASFAGCALLQGLESMKIATAQRNLRAGQLARMEFLSQLAAMFTTISLTWMTRSVWALVMGTTVYSLTRSLLSHFYLTGPHVKPCWNERSAQEIIGFGKWIFLSSIIGFLAAHGEKIILAGLLSPTGFGLFSIASTLLSAVTAIYASLNAHVVFSSLSEALRSDRKEMVRLYSRIQPIADLLLGLMAGVLFFCGWWVVHFLYDARYQSAGWMLGWLSVGLVALRYQVVEQLMFASGHPAWVTANNALRAISLLIVIPLGYAVKSDQGALMGVVLCQFSSWPLTLIFKFRHGLLTRVSETWWLPALVSGGAFGWFIAQGFEKMMPIL